MNNEQILKEMGIELPKKLTKEEALERMDIAIRQDRERFFKVADSLNMQPKYADKLNELETLKEQWRDVTKLEGYPNITHPLPMPEWFPKVHFASRFEKDTYLAQFEEGEEEGAVNEV